MLLSYGFLQLAKTIFPNTFYEQVKNVCIENPSSFVQFAITDHDELEHYVFKFESSLSKIRFTRSLESRMDTDVKIFEVDNNFHDCEEFMIYFLKSKLFKIDMIAEDLHITDSKSLCKLLGFTQDGKQAIFKYLYSDSFDCNLVIYPIEQYASNKPIELKKYIETTGAK